METAEYKSYNQIILLADDQVLIAVSENVQNSTYDNKLKIIVTQYSVKICTYKLQQMLE